MDANILSAILTGAIAELLGGISTEFLSGSTLKIIQHFKDKRKNLNQDIEKVLPAVMSQLRQTHRGSQMLQLLDQIGRNAKLDITQDFFNQATKAYLFKIQWSQFALPGLYEQFCAQTENRIEVYTWEAIQTDLAFFFGVVADALGKDPNWRELLNHHTLRTISHSVYGIAADTRQIVKHFETLLRQLKKPEIRIEDLRADYLKQLKNQFGELDFRGIAQVQNIVKLPLERIFVPLSSVVEVEYRPGFDFEKQPGKRAAEVAEKVTDRSPLAKVIAENPYLVILGDPGSGKSTVLKYISLMFAENQSNSKLNLDTNYLPIFLPIAAYEQELKKRQLSLQQFIPQFYRQVHNLPGLDTLFDHALQNNYALVLLDGLDEVRKWETRLSILQHVENDFLKRYPDNRYIFTSRIAGYEQARLGAPFRHCTVQPFNDDEVKKFAHNWALAYELTNKTEAEAKTPAQKRADDLIENIFSTTAVRELAANPLMVTILALIHHQNVRLPHRRVELYQLCVKALAETWNKFRAEKAIGRPEEIFLRDQCIDERFAIAVLGPVALWMHETGAGGTVERLDLRDKIAEYLPAAMQIPERVSAKDVADEFIQIMEQSCGLMQQKGQNLFSFLHLTFEEYLAGRALIESTEIVPADWLNKTWADDRWKEVIRLAAGGASDREALNFLDTILKLPDEKRPGYRALLAGESLLDRLDRGGQHKSKQAVTDALLAVADSLAAAPEIRAQCGDVLDKLGDPRDLQQFVEVPGGPFPLGITEAEFKWFKNKYGSGWLSDAISNQTIELKTFSISKYPVTCGWYAEFVAEGAYDNPEFWQFSREAETFRKQLKEKRPEYWQNARWYAGNKPVVGVSWYEAVAFCYWLTAKWRQAGKLGPKEQIRLPTEAEWEKAASWDNQTQTKRRWPWGDEFDQARANSGNVLKQTSAVGYFPGASACGALDMAGNAWEWCQTQWRQYPYQPDERESLAGSNSRVVRGGAFDNQTGKRRMR